MKPRMVKRPNPIEKSKPTYVTVIYIKGGGQQVLGLLTLRHAVSLIANSDPGAYKILMDKGDGGKLLTGTQFMYQSQGIKRVMVGDVFNWPHQIRRPSRFPFTCKVSHITAEKIYVRGVNDRYSLYPVEPKILDYIAKMEVQD